jgi:plasmid stability protein
LRSGVDAELKERLVRAARHDRSMKAELCHILSDELGGGKSREPNLAAAICPSLAPMSSSCTGRPPALKR